MTFWIFFLHVVSSPCIWQFQQCKQYFFLPVTSPLTQPQPGEGCSVPLPCQGCHSSTFFALMASEAEEASQGFRSVHGCHVSFCLIHVKVIPSTSAFFYAICWFLRYNSTCWDLNCHHISHQGTENFTGYFLCLCTGGVFLLISIENYYSLLFMYVSLVYMSMQSGHFYYLFIPFWATCYLCVYWFAYWGWYHSSLYKQGACLCACKQLTAFIPSCMCNMFLSVLHKDEPMLWFVLLHAAHLCLHVNTSLHPDDLIM